MKTREVLEPRGVRIGATDWNQFQAIAKEESRKTNTIVTASDVIRHAGKEFLKMREKRLADGKPV